MHMGQGKKVVIFFFFFWCFNIFFIFDTYALARGRIPILEFKSSSRILLNRDLILVQHQYNNSSHEDGPQYVRPTLM
jgi:hypothetical protein